MATRDKVASSLRKDIRAVLQEHLEHLSPAKVISLTKDLVQVSSIAIDREVEAIVETCGLTDDEVGGSFI